MKTKRPYQVRCRVTTAKTIDGYVVATHHTEHHLLSDTYEVTEVFADLYERFRSPQLVGLRIVSIQDCVEQPAAA